MKKVNGLILGLAVLLAFGCGGDEKKKEDPTPETLPQKNCRVIEQVNANGSKNTFVYNSDGKISRINYLLPAPNTSYHVEISYNTAGNIAEEKTIKDKNEYESGNLYSYNADNLPDKIKNYLVMNGDPVVNGFREYKYNASKQVIKINYFSVPDTVLNFYKVYSYSSPNLVVEKQYQRDASGSFYLAQTVTTQYDNNKHPYLALGYYYYPRLVSANNVLKKNFEYRTGTMSEVAFTYVYNSQGYPVQQTTVENRSSGSTNTWTYDCQ
ncbi:hypothetical protein I5M27_09430 [Adhaeribacter sp. BT258]|uniref:DUF4595 domain-containing protein n=1 Tax=Adhaeribacter terrigena TaxID=2793070 RepID=A0ABS1C205_9BACT|nr:hypothetical protein [Adhaeribacter terrigena]MBK0403206.1 hypothetical protein [Adhaeribacter terrigena]